MDFQPKGSEFLVNTTTAGDQTQPVVLTLNGGNLLILWNSDGGGKGQLFDATGQKLGAEFDGSFGSAAGRSIAATPDGGFVASWLTQSGANAYSLVAQRYSDTGAPIGAQFTLADSTHAMEPPGIAVSASGTITAFWADDVGADHNLFLRQFSATGTALADARAMGTVTNSAVETVVTTMADGSLAVGWSQTGGARVEFLSSAGVPNIRGPMQLGNGSDAGNPVDFQLKTDGGNAVMAAWIDVTESNGVTTAHGVHLQAVYSVGSTGPEQTISTDVAQLHSLSLNTLPFGGFSATWAAASGDGDGTAIKAFYPTNNGQGTVAVVNQIAAGDQVQPVVAPLGHAGTAGFIVVWADTSHQNGDAAGHGIEAQLFTAAPIQGTGGNDTLQGTPYDDVMNGLGGDDIIVGYDGNDVLNGGDGNDQLHPRVGVDMSYGGDGNDIIWLEAQSDLFPTEVYDGGAGFDTLYGSTGDVLDISALNYTSIEKLEGDFAVSRAQLVPGLTLDGSFNILDAGAISLDGITTTNLTSFHLSNASGNVFDASGVISTGGISVQGGTGNDSITGGDGNDRLDGGNSGNDILSGGGGDDLLIGIGGFDQFYGGEGNDQLEFASAVLQAGTIFDGGAGTDAIIVAQRTDTVDFSTTSWTSIEAIKLVLSGGVTMRMTSAQLDGLQSITSDTGAPHIELTDGGYVSMDGVGAPAGTTYALSDLGNQIDFTGYLSGAVTVNGGALADTIVGTSAADILHGGGGGDVLVGGSGVNSLDGGTGDDHLYGGVNNDTYYVDSQSDLVFENANSGIDTVVSTANFQLYANVENLTLAAGAGNIFGVGNELANTITGNEGDNTLLAGAGNDVVHAGAGVDIVYGEDGNDQLSGDAGNDFLAGGDGDDVIDGGTGGDSLYGEGGNDTLTGGSDFVFDQLVGGDGNDVLHGDSGLGDYDYLYGNAGDDSFYVDTPDDLVFEQPGEGNDTVYANIDGAGYYLYDNIENLVLTGNTPFGVGNALDNHLTGNAVGNYLLGGDGNDVLNGKGGNDVLYGQAGSDTFVFEHGTGADIVGDFVPGADKIDLSAIGYTSFAQVQAAFHQNGGDLAIDLGNGDLVILQGVGQSQLHASDFIFATAQASAAVPAETHVAAPVPVEARATLLHDLWHGGGVELVPTL